LISNKNKFILYVSLFVECLNVIQQQQKKQKQEAASKKNCIHSKLAHKQQQPNPISAEIIKILSLQFFFLCN
jgi:hypothetical protein